MCMLADPDTVHNLCQQDQPGIDGNLVPVLTKSMSKPSPTPIVGVDAQPLLQTIFSSPNKHELNISTRSPLGQVHQQRRQPLPRLDLLC